MSNYPDEDLEWAVFTSGQPMPLWFYRAMKARQERSAGAIFKRRINAQLGFHGPHVTERPVKPVDRQTVLEAMQRIKGYTPMTPAGGAPIKPMSAERAALLRPVKVIGDVEFDQCLDKVCAERASLLSRLPDKDNSAQ